MEDGTMKAIRFCGELDSVLIVALFFAGSHFYESYTIFFFFNKFLLLTPPQTWVSSQTFKIYIYTVVVVVNSSN